MVYTQFNIILIYYYYIYYTIFHRLDLITTFIVRVFVINLL